MTRTAAAIAALDAHQATPFYTVTEGEVWFARRAALRDALASAYAAEANISPYAAKIAVKGGLDYIRTLAA